MRGSGPAGVTAGRAPPGFKEGPSTAGDLDCKRRRPGPTFLSAPRPEVGKGAIGGGSGMGPWREAALGSGSEGQKIPQSLAKAQISLRHWAWTSGSGLEGLGGFGRRDSRWALSDSPAASAGSSGSERPASEVRPSAEEVSMPGTEGRVKAGSAKEEKKEERERGRGRGRRLTKAPLLEAMAPVAGAIALRIGVLLGGLANRQAKQPCQTICAGESGGWRRLLVWLLVGDDRGC
ncbi:hypothetical protein PPACK8108_LOCUS4013 [Phakopsora pachyrhizi]|uniref:Uncharacterized protein n=1 Tax=Phakopsora pachyrhizi TaxID=170000 RepID=A0AAV0AL47_PHAPC|nr:hypothetical protein PPACK8108_LOCUS4013 [Phakopsora pachyrhizi]